MFRSTSVRKLTGISLMALAIAAGAAFLHSDRVKADDDREASRVQIGFAIAPVPLNIQGKNHDLVGLGSYIVNAIGGCNDCHTNPPYAAGHNPFQGQPKQFNSAAYLGGGTAFGPFISRNLTPNAQGMPENYTLAQFMQVMRTGVDLKGLHPQISPLLQVMPWPVFQSMTDRDLQAIYEYLSSIPCLEGGPGQPPNRC